ncbi:MAG TPA: 3D domain-containing protein [Fervidobacterium sp.]|jgi:3D (Asp-Asp-Asp) domain-containing protein/predicted  nucleic acid-binding Zn-ribbon protein|nr:3D domain-containing protein [Fervidobacterium sp.]HOP82107.1 3D domain-containing protein [Fervidobacterium sp.]HPC79695.1 3D domain-containing protein [Fervidobacterium sp.]HPT58781.1 3D domain-containing protein [Fervidobacterium sp.]HRT01792.1 3D domain-containing protein [Fervidobacterium sp.]
MARIKRKIGFSKGILFAVMLSTITLTLSSCMPLGSALQLSMEVEDLKDRVDYIEERTEIIRPATVTEVVKVDSKALEEVNKKISNLDNKLSQLDSKSVEFDNELSQLSSDLSQVKINVSKSTDKLSQYDSKFLQLDNKLSQYDSKVAQLTTNFSQLDSKLSQTMGSVSNLQKDNDANKSKINTLSTSLTDVLNRVGSLEKSNNNLLNRLNTIDSQVKQIDVIRKDLDILSSQLREVQGSIPTTISQSDVDFLKQLQQQIIELKNAIQSVDPVTLLRLDQGYIYYVVKSGDTLSTIANVYKTALSKITEVNGIKDPSKISIGQMIKIPVDDPKTFSRVPVKIDPADIVTYHGQEKNGGKGIGMDIYARGKDIYPILPGKVISVENNRITIDHGNMIMAVYDGINTTLKSGNFVSTDKPIGQCLDILHFELYIEGEPRDPIRLFTEYKGIFNVTFYTEWDDGKVPEHPTFRIARNGRVPEQFKTIAVDPTVIPVGSLVYIPTLYNTIFIAEDTGSAIKGNRIDVYVSDVALALSKGITPHPVYIINPDKG